MGADGTVDPESDQDLREMTVAVLRQCLRYWKWPKSERHHFDRTGERVDRHRQIERFTREINSRRDRGPGRPLGHELDQSTRMAIAYSRVDNAGKKHGWREDGTPYKESPPPCDDPRVPIGVRDGAFQRDGRKCAACGEYYRIRYWRKFGEPRKRYWSPVKDGTEVVEVQHGQDIRMFLVPGGDPLNPSSLVTLCGFCRQTAIDAGGVDILGLTAEVV